MKLEPRIQDRLKEFVGVPIYFSNSGDYSLTRTPTHNLEAVYLPKDKKTRALQEKLNSKNKGLHFNYDNCDTRFRIQIPASKDLFYFLIRDFNGALTEMPTITHSCDQKRLETLYERLADPSDNGFLVDPRVGAIIANITSEEKVLSLDCFGIGQDTELQVSYEGMPKKSGKMKDFFSRYSEIGAISPLESIMGLPKFVSYLIGQSLDEIKLQKAQMQFFRDLRLLYELELIPKDCEAGSSEAYRIANSPNAQYSFSLITHFEDPENFSRFLTDVELKKDIILLESNGDPESLKSRKVVASALSENGLVNLEVYTNLNFLMNEQLLRRVQSYANWAH